MDIKNIKKKFHKIKTAGLPLTLQTTQNSSGLKLNPFSGKPLGYRFFREKKFGKNRLYFLVYEEFIIVFLVDYSGKKDQQQAINTIKLMLPEYKKIVQEIAKKQV